MFSYDLTDEDYELPYNAPGKSGSYFDLDDDFGRGYPSRRSDGVKLQTILGNSGDLDMERVGGPTGWGTETLDRGIRSFQKRNGLKVDGWVRPGGPTIAKMNEQYGGLLGDYEAPTPKQADTNLRLRDAGQEGFLKGKRQDLAMPPIPGLPAPDDDILGANRSLTRHLRDNGFQLRDTPAYMAKRVQTGKQDGVIEARDFVDQLDQLRPGTGTKAVRGILHALAATPQLQRAFFGGPVVETAPFGVFEQNGPARYEEAIRTRPWEQHDRLHRPGDEETPRPLGTHKPETPEEEARGRVPISYDTRAGADAPAYNDGLLDPTKWPEHLRGQGQAAEETKPPAQDEELAAEAEEIAGEATATDYADDDPEALLAAQAQQPQPGQQPRPPQNQNRQPQPAPQPARPPQDQNRQPQGQDRIPQPPRLAPRRDGDPQAQPPAQAEPQQAESFPPPPRLRPLRPGEAPPHPLDRVGEWESRPDLVPLPGFAGQEWSAASPSFRRNLAIAENNNTAPNPSMQHEAARDGGGREVVLGQYQIKDSTLQEVGLKNRDGTWAPGQLHGTVDGVRREIRSTEDFLKSTDAQDAALSRVLQSYRVQAERRGLDQHIGQSLEGVRFPVLITESGLAAASHRAGVGAVNQYVDRLQRNGWDSDRARRGLDDRQKRLHDAIETRLRLFANERLFD